MGVCTVSAFFDLIFRGEFDSRTRGSAKPSAPVQGHCLMHPKALQLAENYSMCDGRRALRVHFLASPLVAALYVFRVASQLHIPHSCVLVSEFQDRLPPSALIWTG